MVTTKSNHDGLGFLLADVSRLLRRAFRNRLEGSTLTPMQAKALVHISRNEGIRQVDLAEMMEIQPITLARLIDQLAQAGTVERCADHTDRRAYKLYPTPAAKPHLAAIHRVVDAIQSDAFRGWGKKEADAFLAALRTMRETLAAR